MRVNLFRILFLAAAFGSVLHHVTWAQAIAAGPSEPIALLLLGTSLIAASIRR